MGSDAVQQILFTKNKEMWVATRTGGLNKYDPQTVHFKRFIHNDPDPNSNMFELAEASQGNLWLGLHNFGLVKFHRDSNKFEIISQGREEVNGLIDLGIKSLIIDQKQQVWVGAGKGLNHIRVEEDESYKFTSFVHDPQNDNSLISNHVLQVFEDSKNRIWICISDKLNLLNAVNDVFRMFNKQGGNSD